MGRRTETVICGLSAVVLVVAAAAATFLPTTVSIWSHPHVWIDNSDGRLTLFIDSYANGYPRAGISWLAVLAITGAIVVWWACASVLRIGRQFAVGLDGRCQQCGYDLRASPDRCPECGRASAGRSEPR